MTLIRAASHPSLFSIIPPTLNIFRKKGWTNQRPVLGSHDLSTANQRQEREGLKAKIGEGRPTAVSTGVTILHPILTIFNWN